jgi:citrate lyase subunit beta / citryl-CoA lyase
MGSAARLMPLIESAAGVLASPEIARAPRVERLQLGEADLGADTGIDADEYGEQFALARSMVVYASAAAGIGAPVAPVSIDFRDLTLFAESSARLRRLGFFGRACIHPAQVAAANEAFTTDPAAAERARLLLDEQRRLGSAVFTGPDGRLVDEAILRAARRTVSQAFRPVTS